MNNGSLDSLLRIVEGSPQNLLFPGAPEERIAQLEQRLGNRLPMSYRRFLSLTDGALLYQVDEMFGTTDSEDELQESILKARNERIGVPVVLIPFHHSNVFHYFDTTQEKDGEYAVVKWDSKKQTAVPVAGSFAEWLQRYVIDENE